ncbi:MAG TPA: LamG-like jellyroll fold domain-containing protein, partial [Candidatus Paceibacterota bacterium]|nr:LamG-like jellyroll fold domain-containing protein [Candidatus Paceibacterota bacterium]
DTVFRIYYNGTTTGDYVATSTYGAQNVWTNDFIGVWHFNEIANNDPGGFLDSTANLNHGTGTGFVSGDTDPGRLGNALDFNAADWIQTSSEELNGIDQFTASLWFETDNNTGRANMLWQGDVLGNCGGAEDEWHLNNGDCTGGSNFLQSYGESVVVDDVNVTVTSGSTGQWYHAVSVNQNLNSTASGEVFLNGVSEGTDAAGGAIDYTNWDTPLRMGRPGTNERYYDGRLDEVRLASTTRTAAWISAEYTNQATTTDFYSVSSNAAGTVASVIKISDGENGGPSLDGTDYFGSALTSIGDLNGDGVTDFAVGADNDEATVGGNAGEGAVHILFMHASGSVSSTVKISDGENGGPALEADDYFGSSVANIGDLNGDGVTDLAVGAYQDEASSGGNASEGAVHILFMHASGSVSSTVKISDGENGGPAGLENGDSFGSAVTAIGDLNGDGVTDLAVGAESDEGNAAIDPFEGAVYILFMHASGSASSTVKITDGLNGGPSLESFDALGSSIASIGDLDGDGVTDLAVGALLDGATGGDSREGAVFIFFMNTDGSVSSTVKITDGENGGPALEADDYFGSSVANIGDLDGDGVTDLVVGAYNDEALGGDAGEGAIHILFMHASGSASSTLKISDGENGGPNGLHSNDYFGSSIANIGDFDGDGVTDLAVGAYNDEATGQASTTGEGAIFVLFMNGSTTADNIESGGSDGVTITGTLYENDGLTALGAGATITAAIGTSTPSLHSTTTAADGSFSISGIATSTVGAWTVGGGNGGNANMDIVYGNGLFVQTSNFVTPEVEWSVDGINWSGVDLGTNDFDDITYGDGRFVMVADGSDTVAYSEDAVNWTVNSVLGGNDVWDAVAYGEGRFVAVGDCDPSGPDCAMYSEDGGETWTASSIGNDDQFWTDITYGAGRFVAVADDGTYRAAYSEDGITWATTTIDTDDDQWRRVIYADDMFVAQANFSSDEFATSSDGITWNNSISVTPGELRAITYGNGLFIAAEDGASDVNATLYTSTDLTNWTALTAPEAASSTNWQDGVYGAGRFVFVTEDHESVYADAGFGADTPITVFVDANATTSSSTATTLTYGINGDGTITADLVVDQVRLTKEYGDQTIDLADADVYDRSDDTDILFTATSSLVTVEADLFIESGTTVLGPQRLELDGDFNQRGTFYAERGEVVANSEVADLGSARFVAESPSSVAGSPYSLHMAANGLYA